MTVLALKLSRRANAVSSLHGQVSRAMWQALFPGAQRGARSDRPHHQRRPRPHLARAADAPGLRPPPRPRLAAARRRPGFWEPIDARRRRRALGDPPDAQGAADRLRRAAARRGTPSERGESPEFVAQLRRSLSLDALTIGFARRFATYKRANLILQRHRDDGRARQRRADAGPVRLRRQGAPARPARQGGAAADRAADARPAVRRQGRVHRGLRHQRRPPPGAGRRRLAQQPAAAARGLRHQRRRRWC